MYLTTFQKELLKMALSNKKFIVVSGRQMGRNYVRKILKQFKGEEDEETNYN